MLSVICTLCTQLNADYKDAIGYTELKTYLELRGIEVPNGNGIKVTQVEASTSQGDTPAYLPDTTSNEFSGKTIVDLSPGGDISGHATNVGKLFFGNETSVAPGITDIDTYEANDFLNVQGWATTLEPPIETSSVQNHSWVAQEIDDAVESPIQNLIMDYAIQRDDFLLVAGLNNGSGKEIPDLYAHLCNGISVGRADGNHSSGNTQDIYLPGRTKPEIVSDASATSNATPQVSAAASLIYDMANDTIGHRSVKAILLAGANKEAFADWDQTISRPLDETYGAGLLDIFASYQILAGGKQAPGAITDSYGWNLDTLASNSYHTYTFTVPQGFELRNLSILLTWDIVVTTFPEQGAISGDLADMALYLNEGENSLQISDSMVDNVEHIWRGSGVSLPAGQYSITVSTNEAATYALAWRGDLYQGYELWQSIAFSPETPTEDQDRTDDPDKDGIVNLLEMALLTDPENHQLGVLPYQITSISDGDTYQELGVNIPTHLNDLSYTAETATDLLGIWSSDPADVSLVEILPSANGFEQYIFRRTLPSESAEQAFLRLKVEETVEP